MKQLDRGVMARVWGVLNARDARRRARGADERTPILQANAATGDDPAELLIYDEIGGGGFLFGGISASDVVNALAGFGGADLHVRINSPGGDVFDGVAMYNTLLAYPGNVTVTVDGLAASAASLVAMAGDRVVMQRASQLMIHDVWTMAVGNAADMREYADLLDQLSDMLAGVYADRASGTASDWRDIMRAETWYAPDEAVTAGLADAVTPKKGDDGEDAGQGGDGSRSKPKPDDDGEDDEPDTQQDEDAAPGQPKPRQPSMAWDLSGFRYAGRDHAPTPPTNLDAPLLDTAVGPHDTAVKDGTWDAGANEKRLPSPMPVATAKREYGAYDDDAVTDGQVTKAGCHLPHHFVSEDGTPGAASINGVRNALARLPQTQGLSDAERATVERHLNGHLHAYKGDDGAADNSWDDDVAHLTESDRADDPFARLMEAL